MIICGEAIAHTHGLGRWNATDRSRKLRDRVARHLITKHHHQWSAHLHEGKLGAIQTRILQHVRQLTLNRSDLNETVAHLVEPECQVMLLSDVSSQHW